MDSTDQRPVSRGDLDQLGERLERALRDAITETRSTMRQSEAAWQTESRDFRHQLQAQQVQLALHAQVIDRHGREMEGGLKRLEDEMAEGFKRIENKEKEDRESKRWFWAQVIAVASLFGGLFSWIFNMARGIKP